MTRPRMVVPVLVVALAGVGVGATTSTAAPLRITVGDDFFSPSSKTVKKGKKIKFVWDGRTENTHNVKATGAVNKTSEFQKEGTFSFKARKKGVINLVCEVHEEDMVGKITVK